MSQSSGRHAENIVIPTYLPTYLPSDMHRHDASGSIQVARDQDRGIDPLDGVMKGLPFPAIFDRGPSGAL